MTEADALANALRELEGAPVTAEVLPWANALAAALQALAALNHDADAMVDGLEGQDQLLAAASRLLDFAARGLDNAATYQEGRRAANRKRGAALGPTGAIVEEMLALPGVADLSFPDFLARLLARGVVAGYVVTQAEVGRFRIVKDVEGVGELDTSELGNLAKVIERTGLESAWKRRRKARRSTGREKPGP